MNKTGPAIKFCGLTTQDDIAMAAELAIDYIGLVFFPKSPRHLEIGDAARLAQQARGKSRVVALIVNADNSLIDQIAKQVQPDYFQLHGNENAQRILEIKTRTDRPVIKAVGVHTAQDMKQALTLPLETDNGDLFLFDAKPADHGKATLPGGNGIAFDWNSLQQVALPERYMLAGGLTPENVTAAIKQTRAPILDVSSGIEDRPGHKSPERMQLFAQNARKAFAS